MENTLNPSIREEFISTRFYALTFAPNKTNGERPNLVNSTELVHMPTYETEKRDKVIQSFISQDLLNSIISSYADKGKFNVQVSKNSTDVMGTS